MKKFLLVIASIMVLQTINAQTTAFASRVEDVTGTRFSFGPRVGFNVTNITNGLDKNKFSVHAGLFGEFIFTDLIGAQVELLYSRQGERDKIDGVKVWNRVNYLNIPVFAKIYFIKNVSLDLGPQFGIALNGRYRSKDGDEVVKRKIDHLNSFDFSILMGLSYEFETLIVSARYLLGVTNVIDKDYFNDDKSQNRMLQLSLGARF